LYVLRLWHVLQRTQRLSGSQEPPRATGTMWSTSSSLCDPHCWQVNRSRTSIRERRFDQSLGLEAFRALVLFQLFRVWWSRHRPSLTEGTKQPVFRQMLLALGMVSPVVCGPGRVLVWRPGPCPGCLVRSLDSTDGSTGKTGTDETLVST
jgi:hypothetical protein